MIGNSTYRTIAAASAAALPALTAVSHSFPTHSITVLQFTAS